MDYRRIQEPVRDLLAASDRLLKDTIRSRVRLIRRLHDFTPISQGKKIRPTFLFLLAGLNGVATEELPAIAAAIELFHLSSLIHDDIVDNSEWRRGRRTAQAHFGNPASVLWGDYLFMNSLYMVRGLKEEFITDVLVRASCTMVEGQILELENSFNYRLTPRTYFEIIRKKTSALFGAIAEIVGLLADGDKEQRAAISEFGRSFGMMFQIGDDLLDIFSGNSGKDHFRDLQEGKITLPYIIFLKTHGAAALKNFSRKKAKLLRQFNQGPVKAVCQQVIKRFTRRGLHYLEGFDDSPHRRSLLALLEFIAHRDY